VNARSLIPRLTDIIEAIERIRGVLENISLEMFENIGSGNGLSSAASRLFQKPVAISPMT
jgi:hypothetical protein